MQAKIQPILITRNGDVLPDNGEPPPLAASLQRRPTPLSKPASSEVDVELWPQSRVFKWLVDSKLDDYTGHNPPTHHQPTSVMD